MSRLRPSERVRYQVRKDILDFLTRNNFKPGDKLPSETVFVEMLDVSRSSLREGFQLLEQDGIVRTLHGSGRYLSIPTTDFRFDISQLQSVTEMMRLYGIEVSTRVVNVCDQVADDRVAESLELAPGAPVVWIERVRLAGETPIIYSIDIIPKSKLPGELSKYHFEGSLLQILDQEFRIHIDYSRAVIRAVVSQGEIPEGIIEQQDTPWIMMEQVNYDSHATPVIYSKDYHRADSVAFYVTRHRY